MGLDSVFVLYCELLKLGELPVELAQWLFWQSSQREIMKEIHGLITKQPILSRKVPYWSEGQIENLRKLGLEVDPNYTKVGLDSVLVASCDV